jgi:Bacterial Ig domain
MSLLLRALAASVFFAAPFLAGQTPPPYDATAQVQTLGEPFKTRFNTPASAYARNVWDMEALDGRILFGHGNAASTGPAALAGSKINFGSTKGIDQITYLPGTAAFVTETRIPTEQISRHRPVSGNGFNNIWVPLDRTVATNPTDLSYYNRAVFTFGAESSIIWDAVAHWQNSPSNYDVYWKNNRFFAALGDSPSTQQITTRTVIFPSSSNGGGNTKLFVPNPLPDGATRPGRIWNFFEVGSDILASGEPTLSAGTNLGSIYRWTGTQFALHPNASTLFVGAGTTAPELLRIERAIPFNGATAYLTVQTWNERQWRPLSAASAVRNSDGTYSVMSVPLPAAAQPYDLKLSGDGRLLLLINTPQPDGTWRVSVMATADLATWDTLFYFTANTFARSFAALDGDLYFGLGGDFTSSVPADWITQVSPDTGKILRLKKALYNTAPTTTTAKFYRPDASSGSMSVSDPTQGLKKFASDANGDPLTFSVKTPPVNGTLSLNPGGTFLYTPNSGFRGMDTWVYTASDGTSFTDGSAEFYTAPDLTQQLQDLGSVNTGLTGPAMTSVRYIRKYRDLIYLTGGNPDTERQTLITYDATKPTGYFAPAKNNDGSPLVIDQATVNNIFIIDG